MCAGEREVRLVVVEGGLLPRPRCVALLALRAEAAVVCVILEVTTGARRVQAREGAAHVAGFAFQVHVCAGEREVRLVVVEGFFFPRSSVVAGLTLGAKAAIVFVVCLVAGVAVSLDVQRAAFEDEGGQVVAKGRLLPTHRCMATFAGCAVFALVFIIFTVATVAGCIQT